MQLRRAASEEAPLAATQGINLLVLGLDQGSIGAAGYAYSDSIGAPIHCKWDTFHRVIRDINLVVEHSCNGLFKKPVCSHRTSGELTRSLSGRAVLNPENTSWTCLSPRVLSTSLSGGNTCPHRVRNKHCSTDCLNCLILALNDSARQQAVTISTPVLSTRDIPHSARVTKDWWMQHFDSTKDIGYRSKHYCVKHKMPKVWTKVMGPKTWPTVSETVSQKGVAAWQWLQVGGTSGPGPLQPRRVEKYLD